MLRGWIAGASVAGLMAAGLGMAGCAACRQAAPSRPAPTPQRVGRAASIEITPASAVNPVRTQHVFVATVRDEAGNPMPGERVEWIIADGPQSVGDIVEVDGEKVDNHYAVSRTGGGDIVIDRGNADPSDDVRIGRGQSWAVITSAYEGTTNIVAYAPGIANWDRHKAFAEKIWTDVTWEWPLDAINRVGTPHTFTVRVMKHSDGSPLGNYIVNYTVLGGPAGSLTGGQQRASVRTDAGGVASVTLNQSTPVTGVNEVEIQIIRPAYKDECICVEEKLLTTGVVRKTWVAPSIDITKQAPPTALVGQPFDYYINVINPDPGLDVRDVRVSDTLPNGVEYISSNPPAQVSGSTLTWDLGTLPPSGSRALTVQVRATRKSGPGEFENCAVVTAEGGLTDRACAVTVVTAPAISLQKFAPAQVLVCDPITYRLVVQNTGDGPAYEVRIVDNLPQGMTADGRASVDIPVGTLGPGESREFTITAMPTGRGTATNTATATAAGGLSAQASATTTVMQPVLTITKRSTRSDLKTGRPAVWEITVTSSGDVEARDVVLEDMIPQGASFDSATEGGRVQGNMVVWQLGTMAPGQSRTVQMTTIAQMAGTIRNVATARAYCAADVTAQAEVAVTGVPALLLEMFDTDDPVEIGNNTTYVVDVTNQGFAEATRVQIVCTIPAEQDFVSAEGAAPFTVSGKIVTFEPVPVLRPKDRANFRVTVKANAVKDVRFHVRLEADQLDGPVEETESTHTY